MGKKTIAEQITKRMREQGLKVTPSRIRIIEVLALAKRPLSADEVYKEVADTINRVTVYRTLSALESADCASRFTFQNKHVYELATIHSHYLVCRECERVERIPSCTLDDIEKASLRSSKKFASVDHHTLQLSGMCKKCA